SRQSPLPKDITTNKETITIIEKEGEEETMVEKEIFVTDGVKHSIPLEEILSGGQPRRAIGGAVSFARNP
ncbi:MAG: hypothetical protein IIC55_10685, partial [Proteobacteria bacterium]|nr:hypothetical protein [Pseudomonadota bacterium]